MSDRYAEALGLLCDLPQLRPAFASKVCAFLAPTKCGVVDSVMVKNYPRFGFSVDGDGYVTNTSKNRSNYAGYCSFLQEQAGTLNSMDSNSSGRIETAFATRGAQSMLNAHFTDA